MFKCAWLKKMLGLNESACCSKKAPEVTENVIKSIPDSVNEVSDVEAEVKENSVQ